jgi:hypothetical protein
MEDLIMAFASVSGYGNLPNGNFSPSSTQRRYSLPSVKLQLLVTSRTLIISVRSPTKVTQSKIIKEPEISVSAYARGTTIAAQD